MTVFQSSTTVRALILCMCLLLTATAAFSANIHQLTYQGPITPVASEYLVDGINSAIDENAAAVIILIDTPGGLDQSMREIVKAELNSTIPVVVFVSPSGSRAASAGTFITLAAHVAAMTPGTNIGSASPVQMGGAKMDSTMTHKVTNDAAAYISSIATSLNRNPDVARAFVTEALNLTAAEALDQGVIEIMAADIPELIESLHGRTITLNGETITLDLKDAVVVEKPMALRLRMLKHLVDPNVAYLLMMLGVYGLIFELRSPGAIVPGVVGGICLLLALFAFQTLPVDYTGAALILLGVIMLILEVKVISYGVLSIGGLTAMVLGSLMLFDSPEQWGRVSLKVIIPSVMVFGGFFLICVWLAIRGQKRPVTTGLQAMVGETGRLVEAVETAGGTGKAVFHGEMWNVVSEVPLPAESRIRVVEINGRLARIIAESVNS